MRKEILFMIIVLTVICLSAFLLYRSPTVQESLGWRLASLWADIQYALNPPEQVVFVPTEQSTVILSPTAPDTPTHTPTIALATVEPSQTPTLTTTPTLIPTPLPSQAMLSGVLHQFQMWNNCGPANLSIALSFWGWKGDQRVTAAFLKPNPRDKNVMPYEMENFVEQETDLEAVVRVGGELQMLKVFIYAGFPVLVEKGFEGIGFDGWMGHYQVVTGYDDSQGQFIVQDSYKGPDLPIPYESFVSDWRAFNFTYLVIYPPDRLDQVLTLLGLQAYDNFNNRFALQKAVEETSRLTGRDLFFAWFNQGANLVALQDYAGAASAFDTAFANYPTIPEAQRPWRLMWYVTSPYFAYYYTGRYLDVINLATQTLDAMSEPILEESFYWRAKAELALADSEAAIKDLKQCLVVHPEFTPCQEELKLQGVEP
jgi:Peptidase_C39 like family